MTVLILDSSALIPLARVGSLDLLFKEDLFSIQEVYEETCKKGRKGSSLLKDMFDASIQLEALSAKSRKEASELAELEGVQKTDALLILLTESNNGVLLANDKAMIEVARVRGVECWWITTLILKRVKECHWDSQKAKNLVYELIQEGMNLSPRVYARINEEIDRLAVD